MNGRNIGFWIGLAGILLLVALALGRGRTEGPPFDPAATDARGTRALVELVIDIGGQVDHRLPDDRNDVALVLVDREIPSDRRAIERFARNGGIVVVADQNSWLSPSTVDLADSSIIGRGQCDIAELDDVDRIRGRGLTRFAATGEMSCFGDGELSFVVAEPFGEGRLIHLGSPDVFTNEFLDEEDNAVLAARLLVREGRGRVAVVFDAEGEVGDGTDTLFSLIPGNVRWFALQLTLAFALLVAWRARRFGRVVTEPLPVEMPGSLLVQASGELRRRARGHDDAIRSLRADIERRLRHQFRLPSEHLVEQLPTLVSRRCALTEAEVVNALLASKPPTAEGLESVATAIDRVTAVAFAHPVADRPDLDLVLVPVPDSDSESRMS